MGDAVLTFELPTPTLEMARLAVLSARDTDRGGSLASTRGRYGGDGVLRPPVPRMSTWDD